MADQESLKALLDRMERLDRTVSEPHAPPVSEHPTRDEFAARLEALDARADARFIGLTGEVREQLALIRHASIGKTSFFLGLLAFFAAIVAVLAYAGQWFGLGLQSHDALVAAAQEGAKRALAARGGS